jgi:hypothetical protein
MKHKGNGKTPPRSPRKPNGGSRADDAKGRDQEIENVEDRESGLKQGGLSDVGGTGPRKKTGRDH